MRHRRNGPLSYAPAFVTLLGLSFSLYLSYLGYSPLISAIISVLIVSSWVLAGTSCPTNSWGSAFTMVILLTFALSFSLNNRIVSEVKVPSTIRSEGRILLNREWGCRRALLISTEYGKMVAYLHPPAAPAEGSGINLRGALFEFKRSEKKGGFDEYLYWRSKGALRKIISLNLKVTAPPRGIHKWRNFLGKKIVDDLPDLMSGYMLALTLGIKDKKLTEKHREAGTVHLLAVSGFHVGILAAFAGLLLKRGKIKIVIISLLVWSYVALAGFPAGGVRAGIMLQVYLLGLFFGRSSTPFNSVSVAGIAMLLWNPWLFHDVGWRLSMLAALSICAAAGIFKEKKDVALVGSAIVWFLTAPLIASAFGEVPVVGLVINILAIPLFAIIFPFVFLCSIPSFLGLPFSQNIADICEYLLESWDILSETLVGLMPWSLVLTFPLTVLAVILFFAAVSYASGISLKRIPLLVLMFSLIVLIFA